MQRKWPTVVALACVIGGLTLLACTAVRALQQTQDRLVDELPVTVFFQAAIPDEQSHALSETLKTQDADIEKISYLSKDQAYAEASKDPLLSRSLMLLRDNPLSAVIDVRYSRHAWIQRQDPALALHQLPGVQEIRWNAARRDALIECQRWVQLVIKMVWGMAIVLMLAALVGIGSIVRSPCLCKTALVAIGLGVLGAALSLAAWPFLISAQRPPILPLFVGALTGLALYSVNEER